MMVSVNEPTLTSLICWDVTSQDEFGSLLETVSSDLLCLYVNASINTIGATNPEKIGGRLQVRQQKMLMVRSTRLVCSDTEQ